jgi:glycosyltransferase involved in cell wall biosynthesis
MAAEGTSSPPGPMKRLLLVCDPLGGSQSVQLELLLSMGKRLQREFRLSVFTPYCDAEKAELIRGADFDLHAPSNHDFVLNRGLRHFGQSNESMLWAESWLRETLFRSNRLDADHALAGVAFDRVLNMSSTVPYPCDLWWIQGMPLDLTIAGMASTNWAASVAYTTASPLIARLDHRMTRIQQAISGQIVASSPFLMDLYRKRGVDVNGVIYSVKDLGPFRPSNARPSRDYVLTYVGKEIERLDFRSLKAAGVRVVGFGGKIPAGTRLSGLTDVIEFRGSVPHRELVDLYSNALFTLFPFSSEALGYVPLESMACGTPVLTFDRQGPGETVVNGRTGWLVQSRDEMVRKAEELWHRGMTGISSDACVQRASAFSLRRSVDELMVRFEHIPRGG